MTALIGLLTATLRSIRKAGLPFIAALSLMLSLIPSNLVFAATNNKLFAHPATSQMNMNTTFCIDIRSYADSAANPGTAIGALEYPAGMLQVVDSILTNGNTCNGTAASNYGTPNITQTSGRINFTASQNQASSGIRYIFSVKFKAISSGSATVNFTNTSKVNGTTTEYVHGNYTITNPNPPPPPSSSPQPSSSPKPSSSPNPPSSPRPSPVPVVSTPDPTTTVTNPDTTEVIQPTPDPTGVIDGVSVLPVYTTATVTWKVNASNPSTSVNYGTSTAQLNKKASVTKNQDGTYTASITDLIPGTRYMFTISASGNDGKTGNYTGSIPTRGYPVTITVTENNAVVANGQIKIGNQSAYINSSGKVTLGLAAGNYSGTITTDTASLSISLTVATKTIPASGSAPEPQSFAYNLTSSPLEQGPGSGSSILAFVSVMAAGAVILGLGFVGFMAYRRRRFESGDDDSYTMSSTSSVIIDDGYNWHQNQSQTLNSPADSAGSGNPQQTPVTNYPQAPIQPTGAPHHNAVYLSEEEPLDMFEQAAQKLPLPPEQHSSSSNHDVTGHIPSSPHSTTT